jgi:hypothetical protein
MRTPIRRVLAGLSTAATLWILPGCGDGAPRVDSSMTEATVKGVVKIDGVPATEGEIVFNPANNKRPTATPRSAPIGKDGTYTIKTLTGTNEVKLGGSLVKKSPLAGRATKVHEVTSGENTFDYEGSSGTKK